MVALEGERDAVNTLVNRNPCVSCRTRTRGVFRATYVSAGVTALVGYRPREFTDDGMLWVDLVHPEDRPRVLAELGRIVETGSGVVEYRLRRREGDYRWVRDERHVVAGSGEAALIGYWTDINDSREFELALRERRDELEQLTRTAPIGIALMDRSLRYVRVNDSLARNHSRSADELIGLTVRDVLPAALADKSEACMRRVLDFGKPVLDVELTGGTAATGGQESPLAAQLLSAPGNGRHRPWGEHPCAGRHGE